MPILLLFQMDLDEDTAEKFYQKLLKLEKQIRVTIQETNNQNWKWCSLKHSVPFGDSGVREFLLSWIMCICGKHWFLMVSSSQNHLCDYVCVCMWEKNICYFISLYEWCHIKVVLEEPNWVSVCSASKSTSSTSWDEVLTWVIMTQTHTDSPLTCPRRRTYYSFWVAILALFFTSSFPWFCTLFLPPHATFKNPDTDAHVINHHSNKSVCIWATWIIFSILKVSFIDIEIVHVNSGPDLHHSLQIYYWPTCFHDIF